MVRPFHEGRVGRWAFLPCGCPWVGAPSPYPHPSCAGSSGGWARHTFLCSQFLVLSEDVCFDGQAYSYELFFICTVFFCINIYFLMAVLHNWVCCLLLGPPLENNPEIPPSSRAEGLRLLHGLETNLATSLQTPQEA